MLNRLLLYGALGLAAVAMGWGHGYATGVQRLYEYQAEQAREGARIVVRQGAVTERVVIRYIKAAAETQRAAETVEREVVRYVPNPDTALDARWGLLHDAAANRTVPPATGGPDDAGAAPSPAQALATVTGNYAEQHRCVDRLTALQDWVREQFAAAER